MHHKHIFWIKPLLLSCIMSGFISCSNTFFHENGNLMAWLRDWMESWLLAYPILLICLPFIEKLLTRITR
ncbi:DUF2798 domain-containing protein [Acinetobacter sp. ANC 4558]|uniref:DUF2798 domain-containing protein n=1 Tax=Acinetobacter sp. ANC 4558 TaxID=1977876 RepID=UPI002ADF3372|nr:DUF2798 domain-containing protein [Acinetobacter sp. ANC 4558]